ncbi:UxaA family hydrolase [Paenibacillus sp. TRM 82003]|nr:UxaA family hydrolase [Paenibacillus sp. TRM 82003]
MAGEVQSGADVIRMHADDHVATALRDIAAGETITYRFAGERFQIEALDDIAFGHKVAIADIPEGARVKKYGEVIGRATTTVEAGRHVHVHNLEGIRGRGDQAGKGASAL